MTKLSLDLEPNLEPKKPPISTEITNGNKILISRFNWPEILAPNNPAIELTQINKAEVAATVLGFAHFLSKIIGDKKIPPPTPIIPLKKPIPAPEEIEIF